jgi:hypothetical protein
MGLRARMTAEANRSFDRYAAAQKKAARSARPGGSWIMTSELSSKAPRHRAVKDLSSRPPTGLEPALARKQDRTPEETIIGR